MTQASIVEQVASSLMLRVLLRQAEEQDSAERPGYNRVPVETVLYRDTIVEFGPSGRISKQTTAERIDHSVCKNHVHINDDCYDRGFPVWIRV